MNAFSLLRKESYKNQTIELKSLELLNKQFDHIRIDKIRIFLNRILESSKDDFGWKVALSRYFEVFEINTKKNQDSLLVKYACFIHIIFQQMKVFYPHQQPKAQQYIQKLMEYLNRILQSLQKSGLKKQKSVISKIKKQKEKQKQKDRVKQRSFSVENTFGWLKDKVSRSKNKDNKSPPANKKPNVIPTISTVDTPQKNFKISDDKSPKKRGLSKQQSTLKSNNNNIFQKKQLSSQISSPEIMFKKKIFEPYIAYLLKIFSSNQFYRAQVNGKDPQIQPQQYNYFNAWKILNMLKTLIKITEKFTLVFRYYYQEYLSIIICIIKVIHLDIKLLYRYLSEIISRKEEQINSEFVLLRHDNTTFAQIELIEKKLIEDCGLVQFRKLIDEIAAVNEGLYELYFSKYIYRDLFIISIKPQKFIRTSGADFQVIFALLLKKQKKQLESIRRKSTSKSKSKQKFSLDPSKKVSQQKNNILMQTKKFNPAARQRDRLKLTIKQNNLSRSGKFNGKQQNLQSQGSQPMDFKAYDPSNDPANQNINKISEFMPTNTITFRKLDDHKKTK